MSEPGEGVTANRTLRERSHAKQLPSRTRSKKSKKRVAIIRVSNRTRSPLDSRNVRIAALFPTRGSGETSVLRTYQIWGDPMLMDHDASSHGRFSDSPKTAIRGTCAGAVAVLRLPFSPARPHSPDFMGTLMSSQLNLRTRSSKQQDLLSRPATCRPVIGRDESGRLCLYGPDRADRIGMSGPGGWKRVASFEGLASCQRGPPLRTLRMGPGPEQSMPYLNHSVTLSARVKFVVV